MEASLENPLHVTNSTTHTNYWTTATFHQEIANSGSWLQFSRDGISNTWQAGMSSDSSYVIRASGATACLSVNQNGDTTISGSVSAQQASLTSSDADNLLLVITRTGSSWFLGEYVASETNSGGLFKYKTAPGEWWHGVWGTSSNELKIWFNYKVLSLKQQVMLL